MSSERGAASHFERLRRSFNLPWQFTLAYQNIEARLIVRGSGGAGSLLRGRRQKITVARCASAIYCRRFICSINPNREAQNLTRTRSSVGEAERANYTGSADSEMVAVVGASSP